jgi:hypothetical protein
MKTKPKFTQVFATTPAINWLAAARFFLFGARDIWFVVALPVFLYSVLGWSFTQVGGFLAFWIIGYGMVQAAAPRLLRGGDHKRTPGGGTARIWALVLALVPAGIALALSQGPTLGWPPGPVLILGLILFGVVFAINSAVHSYLILAYSDFEKVSMNVGFYYMANAGGRLTGTLLSGLVFQTQGARGMPLVVQRLRARRPAPVAAAAGGGRKGGPGSDRGRLIRDPSKGARHAASIGHHLPTVRIEPRGDHAHGRLPVLLGVPPMSGPDPAQARRLLRLLLLWHSPLPARPAGRPTRLLRELTPLGTIGPQMNANERERRQGLGNVAVGRRGTVAARRDRCSSSGSIRVLRTFAFFAGPLPLA